MEAGTVKGVDGAARFVGRRAAGAGGAVAPALMLLAGASLAPAR